MATKSATKSKKPKSATKSKKPKSVKNPKVKTESYDDLYKKISILESKIDEIEKQCS